MLLATDYEGCVEVKAGLQSHGYQDVEFTKDGSGVVLRVVDVRTYGGQIRLYMDAEGKSIDTGSTTIPMRVRRPFRLAPFSAYVIYFHLSLKDLPKNVLAKIVPSTRMADIGLLMTEVRIVEGELQATVLPLRAIEVIEGYPVAELVFEAVQSAGIEVKGTLETTSRKSKGTINAKNPSNRR